MIVEFEQATAASAAAPGRAFTRLAVGQVWRGMLIVASAIAGMSALVASQYQTTFAGAVDAAALRALAENPAIRILFGMPLALDDPGGFTVWRTGTPVQVLAAVWALLTATRITRGEEDAGRWDLLLGGRLRTVDLVLRCWITLAVAAVVNGIAVAAALVASGTDIVGAVVHAVGVLGTMLMFAGAGLFAAQLLPSRAAAAGLTGGFLGVCLLLRMLADGVPQLAWVAWCTPFGLTARAAPYADNRGWPLAVLVALAVLLAGAACTAARHRDLGGAPLAMPTSRPPRTRLLGSVAGFCLRRALRPTVGWAVGIAAYYFLVGALLASILQFLDENPRFAELAATAGFGGLDTATGFAAALFSLLAIPTGLYAATRLTVMASDERARRWTAIYALPLSRARLAGTDIAVTAWGVVLLLLTAAVAMWAGAAITRAPLTLTAALAGALNAAPVAWLALGAAAFALGWFPSTVAALGALPVVGGFLLDVIVSSIQAPAWLTIFSPFAHLAAVPDTPPNWTASSVLTLIAAALTTVGLLGYSRRDLNT
ncbi:polyketide antibiotic transporter [Nocardia amamiensis]|uniref:polyketide antibiotic transporter n=1 Tax=Nocardia amamiensis TaxID=404578 RepID=UPI00083396FA|nr:polyketide antibiotic transporter [Nocardia amamiensis]